jgi:hypothetical protein
MTPLFGAQNRRNSQGNSPFQIHFYVKESSHDVLILPNCFESARQSPFEFHLSKYATERGLENEMIRIKHGSHSHILFEFLSVVGEFPISVLPLLGSNRNFRLLVQKYTQPQDICFTESGQTYRLRMLSVSGNGKLKTVRFRKRALDILGELHPQALQYYLQSFSGHHFPGNEAHIDRNHRVAECVAMAGSAGLSFIPYQLPQLQKLKIMKTVPNHPSFYFGKNIKRLDTAELNKTMFTRVSGAAFYPGGCYAVYNTRNSVMKWSGMGEYKTLHHLNEVARMNAGVDEIDSAILFGINPNIALETLLHQRRSRKSEMRFDRIYRHVHFLPLDNDGIQLLQILVISDWKERLMQALFPPEIRPEGIPFMEYDAVNGSTYIFSHIDSDIARLSRLHETLSITEYSFEILCLSWQVSFLKSYLGNRVSLKVIAMESVKEVLSDA